MDKQKNMKVMVVGPDFKKVEEFLKKKIEKKIATLDALWKEGKTDDVIKLLKMKNLDTV